MEIQNNFSQRSVNNLVEAGVAWGQPLDGDNAKIQFLGTWGQVKEVTLIQNGWSIVGQMGALEEKSSCAFEEDLCSAAQAICGDGFYFQTQAYIWKTKCLDKNKGIENTKYKLQRWIFFFF